jgi:hypothetical protein
VPFVGAGISCLAGCPNWAAFAAAAMAFLIDGGHLSPLERRHLENASPRLQLSLAQLRAAERGVLIDFREILQPKKWHEHLIGLEVYSHIGQLGDRFVTTNYDQWLDTSIPKVTGLNPEAEPENVAPIERKVLYEPKDFRADNFTENTVVHLHGSIADPRSMVLSTTDYLHHYANDRHRDGGDGENPVLSFLEFLFQGAKTVLFLGYGLEELEIVEYILLKSRQGKNVADAPHFMLQGFYSTEATFAEELAKYYLQLGVVLIPFLRDHFDWKQTVSVLQAFAQAMPQKRGTLAQDLADMERLANV